MSRDEIAEKLTAFGLKLDTRPRVVLDAFCIKMERRQYGQEETADAYLWFESGWLAAKKRLE